MRATGKQRGGVTGKGFLPGQSGNPAGRAKGLSTVLRKETLDGEELARFWLGVMRDRRRGMAIRVKASELVAAYGFGKPIQPLERPSPTMNIIIDTSAAYRPKAPKPVDGERQDRLAPGPQPDRLALGRGV